MNKRIFAAEYVLPGHPDRLCDAIADGIVAAAAARERRALCGIEVAVHRAAVFITGRVACEGVEKIDVGEIARDAYRRAGYGADWAPAPDDISVLNALCTGPLLDGEAEFRAVADDQSIVTGYAVDLPGTNYMPPEHYIAWRIAGRLEGLREEHPELALGPDGKLIVQLEEEAGKLRLVSLSASLQQSIGADTIGLHRVVRDLLAEELRAAAGVIPNLDPAAPDDTLVNGAGNFEQGGPEGDNGLSGKKLVVDAYGPRVPIGGGALSGKDFFKADRAGAILARRLAKAIVMTGGARECFATLAFHPGDRAAKIIRLVDEAGRTIDPLRWTPLFDLTLESCGEAYAGLGLELREIAVHGHFTSPERPWEVITFRQGELGEMKP